MDRLAGGLGNTDTSGRDPRAQPTGRAGTERGQREGRGLKSAGDSFFEDLCGFYVEYLCNIDPRHCQFFLESTSKLVFQFFFHICLVSTLLEKK